MRNKCFGFYSLIFTSLVLLFSQSIFAKSFPAPKAGDTIVGYPQSTSNQNGDDFSDVALRYDLGFYELLETNPGIDSNNPPDIMQIILPTQYVLPSELKKDMVLINLAEMRIYYRPSEINKIYIYPIGIGKTDWDTPTGEMKIIRKVRHPNWVLPESIRKYRAAHGEIMPKVIPAGPENPQGDYKLDLSIPALAIHGTNLAAAIGRRSSAGCIRLYNSDIQELFNMVKVGTKVLIINRPYKAGWLNGKLYLEAHEPLMEQRLETKAGDRTSVIHIIEKANKDRHVNVDWPRIFRITDEHIGVPRPVEKFN